MLSLSSSSSAAILDTLLLSRLPPEAKIGQGQGQGQGEVRWQFVVHCLEGVLSRLVDPPSSDPVPLFSVKDQHNVSGLIQMILALGLIPNLIPGVGLPLEKRSKFVQCLQGDEKRRELTIEEVRSPFNQTSLISSLVRLEQFPAKFKIQCMIRFPEH